MLGRMSFITYQLLRGFFQEGVTDSTVLQEAFHLEKQGLVSCSQTNKGLKIQPCLEGIDRWMQNKLKQESLHWIRYRLCFYGIYNPSKPVIEHIVKGQRTLLVPYEPLKISTDSTQKDSLCFADLFCEKLPLHSVVQSLLTSKTFLILENSKQNLFLNNVCIASAKSILKKGILKILIQQHQEGRTSSQFSFLSLEKIAQKLHETEGVFIEDIDNKIRRPLRLLRKFVSESLSLPENAFIEIKKGAYRLTPSLLVKNS